MSPNKNKLITLIERELTDRVKSESTLLSNFLKTSTHWDLSHS